MKLKAFIKKYQNWIAAVLIIAFCINLYFKVNVKSKQTTGLKYEYYHITDTAEQKELNYDSMPCKMAQFAKDSLKRLEDEQKRINDGNDAQGEVMGGEFLWGLAFVRNDYSKSNVIRLNTPFNFSMQSVKQESNTAYFISLYPYEMPDNSFNNDYFISHKDFIAQNNKYYLKYVVKDSVNEGDFYGHYTYRQIPIKYVKEYRALLVPVTYTNYLIADVFGFMVRFFCQLLVWYFLFYLPIKTIISISKGTPFDQKNIWRLSFISYFLILFPFVLSGIKMLIHLLFLNKIPVEFTFHLQEYFFSYFKYILSGVVVFIIAQAFKRGYNLQKEQELTI